MPAPSSIDDLKVLRDAVRDEMAGKRDHILVDFDQQQYLPAFDNVVHYIGITSDRQIHIIVSYAYSQPRHSKIDTFETSNIAVVEAFVLGTMDIGAAGVEWKAYRLTGSGGCGATDVSQRQVPKPPRSCGGSGTSDPRVALEIEGLAAKGAAWLEDRAVEEALDRSSRG
jgi:hypothetical protein